MNQTSEFIGGAINMLSSIPTGFVIQLVSIYFINDHNNYVVIRIHNKKGETALCTILLDSG